MIGSLSFLRRESIAYLVFWVTQRCNARCPFCFNPDDGRERDGELDVAEIRRLAAGLTDLQYVTLAGGEPTLRTDLADIVSAFAATTGVRMCTIVSNGFRWQRLLAVAQTVAERHPRLGLNIGVSIDFPEAEHDRHRGLSGCYEGCIRTIEGITELRRRHPNVMVCANGTYTRENAATILETAKYVMERYRIPYSVGLVRGAIGDETLKEVSIDRYHETARAVLRLQRQYLPATTPEAPVRFALEDMAVDAVYRSVVEQRAISRCQGGRRAVLLTSTGDLRLCEMLPTSFGNVRTHDYDIPAMLRLPENRALVERVWRQQCHCTWECYAQVNLAYDRRRWPKLLLKSIAKALAARR